jgi:hypothetical protein
VSLNKASNHERNLAWPKFEPRSLTNETPALYPLLHKLTPNLLIIMKFDLHTYTAVQICTYVRMYQHIGIGYWSWFSRKSIKVIRHARVMLPTTRE